MENIICMEHISRSFKKKNKMVQILSDISLMINKGEFVGIIGKSGAGKTTLLKILGLLDRQNGGKVILFNQNINDLSDAKKAQLRNEKLGFILQDYALINSYTVMENVEIPLIYSKQKFTKKEKRKKVYDILEKLDMNHHIDDSCENLSGGEKQRVAIARAIINNPEIIIADEPTGALDEETASEFLMLLTKLNQEFNKTVVLVTHDRAMLKNCTQVYELENGKLNLRGE